MKYTGRLGKKRKAKMRSKLPFLMSLEEKQCEEIEIVQEGMLNAIEGLGLLLDHYKLKDEADEFKWLLLALALARDHVPMFNLYDKQGGEVKRHLAELYGAVEITKMKQCISSTTDACRHLRRQDPAWRNNYPDINQMIQAYKNTKRRPNELTKLASQLLGSPEAKELCKKSIKKEK